MSRRSKYRQSATWFQVPGGADALVCARPPWSRSCALVNHYEGRNIKSWQQRRRGEKGENFAAINSIRLEGLKGDRKGQYSIRINDQWRICFKWPKNDPGPSNVEIVDYH